MQNMTRMLRLGFVALLVCFANIALAQNGTITGTLKDERGNPVVNAYVEVSAGNVVRGREVTDFDGIYTVRPLDGGRYDVIFKFQGKELRITDISLAADQTRTVNGTLVTATSATGGRDVVVRTQRYVAPLIDPKEPGGRSVKTAEQIEKTATRSSLDIASLSTQTYQGGRGEGIAIGGGRASGTKVIIDGVQQNPGALAFVDQAPGSVEAITTFSSGVPARYGDASGGLITITTKGPSTRHQGNIQYERSFDGYNRNQLTANLSGPLLRRKDSTGGYRNVVGYTISADGIYAADNDPQYYKTPYLKPEVLRDLQENPVRLISTNGIQSPEYSSLYVTEKDIEYKRRQPNAEYYRGQVTGKLDFNLTPTISVRVGGTYNVADAANYSRYASLFASDQFRRTLTQRTAGYVRLTQKFGTAAEPGKTSSISNAFYTVQVDYSKDWRVTRDPNKGTNTFDYGYVGRFQEQYRPAYDIGGIDPTTGKAGVRLVGYAPTGVVFTPGTQNPLMANYTKKVYELFPNPVDQLTIQGLRGLRNGDRPSDIYNLWSNSGAPQQNTVGWAKSTEDQVAVQVDASFDLKHNKTTHNVQFGLYYQQRNERNYNVSGSGIWTLMRQLTSRVVSQEVETSNAIFRTTTGQTYTTQDVLDGKYSPSPNDTIVYDRRFDNIAQSAFDARLRQKLFNNRNAKEYINTDALAPSEYDISLFSPDDLFNGGSAVIGYYGYDYTGKSLNGQVNFNDFWTAKDAEGYYTRPISAYRPNYIAGYLSDYITFKDFNITLGMRIERFDNNTKVLKDPYSIYGVKKISDAPNMRVPHPENISKDAVIYVSSNSSVDPTVIGYRNGDTWYNAQGIETPDPQLIRTETGSDVLVPFLNNPTDDIKKETYDVNGAFEDYKPQVNVMPRINFSFPLNDNALFYAHYDVMYQRPNVGAYATQTDYMFLNENPSRIYDNSNLRPERAVDYEVGFQQRISANSGITLSGFYKERKDQIQVRPYIYAYPLTYYSYGNRDFSSYKGLSLAYELRRTNHVALNINYTLSFTEGTGSSATSANGGNGNNVASNSLLAQLIQSGLPNIRPQFPLTTDSRHNINAQVDYRFMDNEGPMVGGSRIFQNAGINFVFRARTGEPYTKYQFAQSLQQQANNSPVIVGTVNGSRLNAHYGFDVRLDKTVFLRYKEVKSDDGKVLARTPTRFGVNIYAYAQNLLNIRDVRAVYGYTGRADDDGFLTSTIGQREVGNAQNAQSFQDLYRVSMYNPYIIGSPRTFLVGASLNF